MSPAVTPKPAPIAQYDSLCLSVNNAEGIYDHVMLVLKGVSLQVPVGRIVALLGQMARARRRH